MSISLSKWPMLPTMAPCFMRPMCSADDDVLVAGGGDEDVGPVEHRLERGDLVAVHGGLQRADRVDLGDDHPGALAPQGLGAALAHVAVAADDGNLAADHDVGAPVDAVDQAVAAAVLVVELGLGDRVVDVDGREQQLCPPASSGRGGARRWWSPRTRPGCPADGRSSAWGPRPAVAVSRSRTTFHSSGSSVGGVGHGAGRLVLGALVHEHGGVATVVEDQVRPAAVGPAHHLLGAPPVLLQRLALPGVDRACPGGRRRCRRDRPPWRRRRGPGWRRCCRAPSGPRRRARPGSR